MVVSNKYFNVLWLYNSLYTRISNRYCAFLFLSAIYHENNNSNIKMKHYIIL